MPHRPSPQAIGKQAADAGHECKNERGLVAIKPAADQIGRPAWRHCKWLRPGFPQHHGCGDVARANHADANAVGMQQSAQREAIIQDCGFARAISGGGMKPALELTMAICPRSRTIIHQ
jgi:hypothetical protein